MRYRAKINGSAFHTKVRGALLRVQVYKAELFFEKFCSNLLFISLIVIFVTRGPKTKKN
jgi:hypothetical protein